MQAIDIECFFDKTLYLPRLKQVKIFKLGERDENLMKTMTAIHHGFAQK